MVDLTVRNVSEEVVDALKRRAAANGRSMETEHRELLRAALLDRGEDFTTWAHSLRQRLRSSVDTTDIIRVARAGVP